MRTAIELIVYHIMSIFTILSIRNSTHVSLFVSLVY